MENKVRRMNVNNGSASNRKKSVPHMNSQSELSKSILMAIANIHSSFANHY